MERETRKLVEEDLSCWGWAVHDIWSVTAIDEERDSVGKWTS